MDKNNFFKKDALRPTEEQRLLTKPFYRNSNVIYAHFDEWKDIDRFYFIPLYLEMTCQILCGWAPSSRTPSTIRNCISTSVRSAEKRYSLSDMLAHHSLGVWTWKDTVIATGEDSRQSPAGSSVAKPYGSSWPLTSYGTVSISCFTSTLNRQP